MKYVEEELDVDKIKYLKDLMPDAGRNKPVFDKEHEEGVSSILTSIEKVGLLNEIICVERNGEYYCIAGQKRLAALKLAKNRGTITEPIKVKLYQDLSDTEIIRLSFDENDKRVELSFDERLSYYRLAYEKHLQQGVEDALLMVAVEYDILPYEKDSKRRAEVRRILKYDEFLHNLSKLDEYKNRNLNISELTRDAVQYLYSASLLMEKKSRDTEFEKCKELWGIEIWGMSREQSLDLIKFCKTIREVENKSGFTLLDDVVDLMKKGLVLKPVSYKDVAMFRLVNAELCKDISETLSKFKEHERYFRLEEIMIAGLNALKQKYGL